jgi:hypothetical protein
MKEDGAPEGEGEETLSTTNTTNTTTITTASLSAPPSTAAPSSRTGSRGSSLYSMLDPTLGQGLDGSASFSSLLTGEETAAAAGAATANHPPAPALHIRPTHHASTAWRESPEPHSGTSVGVTAGTPPSSQPPHPFLLSRRALQGGGSAFSALSMGALRPGSALSRPPSKGRRAAGARSSLLDSVDGVLRRRRGTLLTPSTILKSDHYGSGRESEFDVQGS